MKKSLWFWLLPPAIFFMQYFYTANSMGQIRYEELAESVRNVYWLENRAIYDGVSSNIGWYGTLLLIYKSIGFSLFSAKIFRLFLFLVSLFCSSALLKKYLGSKNAIVPLITIGLSPTILFFNTIQTAIGVDLLYLPICLYLVLTLNLQRFWSSLGKQFLLWSTAMVAWMSYPTFVFYLPALGIIYLWQIYSQKAFKKPLSLSVNFLASSFSFVWPLAASFLYVKDKSLLIYDPVVKSGIFRGAGSFNFDIGTFLKNLSGVMGDLFIKSGSYYYETSLVEFSVIFPVVSVISVLLISIFLLKKTRNLRFSLLVSWLTLIFALTVANLTADPTGYPGMRRNTAMLAAFYVLFTVIWSWSVNLKKDFQLRTIIIAILFLIPFHHLLAYSVNLFNLGNPSPFQYSHIFSISDTPSKSLELLVQNVQKEDLKLGCKDEKGNLTTCRYVEGYAAVSGYCLWNNLKCKNVLGYDSQKSEFIPLTIDLWETYYFQH